MDKQSVSAVILAGGKATRFGGRPKSFIQIDGLTILERNLRVLKDFFEEIILITNTPEIYDYEPDLKVYPDIIPDKGPLSGIHSALSHITTDAAFVFACDMPNLDRTIIANQLDGYLRKPCRIHIPVTGRGQEPLHGIYPVEALGDVERILKQYQNPRIRILFSHFPTLFRRVDNIALAKHVFLNVNTNEDLRPLTI